MDCPCQSYFSTLLGVLTLVTDSPLTSPRVLSFEFWPKTLGSTVEYRCNALYLTVRGRKKIPEIFQPHLCR